ncbi:hypothetical protein HHS34_005770 [Acidithiobacillus montserratensis]|uniref:Uncharacterized protein n=1 Tax=Acidithiobacillus montserratensis TaxID=2729135 RepID=A0ACD5HIF7_9PROT|nr:hypothetical protein [Acidithiobacillus montserratensis]MBU2748627.1 hypothetical protein [Acidithiobacillus montserratensis]
MALTPAAPHGIAKSGCTALAVQYRDGPTLTYLFNRATKIVEIMAAVRRAGRVQKVVLWDEMPKPDTGNARKVALS